MCTIVSRIKKIRKEKKLSITAVANLFAEKRQRLQDIEGGKQKVPEEILVKYIEYFHINGTWLLTGKGEMYRQEENQVTDIKAGYATGIVTPSAVLNRMCLVLNVQADRELSKQLDQEIQQLTKWRESGQVPFEVCESFADAQKISLNWLITGFGDMNGSDAITRRMYLMLQLMEQLPDQQQQEVLSAAKEKQRINTIEQQLAAFMAIKKGS